MSLRLAPVLALALACTPETASDLDDDLSPDTSDDVVDTEVGPQTPDGKVFSFAIVADPHVANDSPAEGNGLRQQVALDWIEDEADDRGIEFVLVVGDVAWGKGLDWVPEVYADFPLPIVPIIGDNELKNDEERFWNEFQEVWDGNADDLDDFELADAPVDYPDARTGKAWFTNLAFSWKGIRFLGLDWASRVGTGILSELAELHDIEGGSFEWFETQLNALEPGPRERVVVFTHNPMLTEVGGFPTAEADRLKTMVDPWLDQIAAAHGGHLHIDSDILVGDGGMDGYEVVLTDATWDDDVRVLVVDVIGEGDRYAYTYEKITVELP